MDKPTHRVRRHDAEEPEDDEDDGDGFEHGSDRVEPSICKGRAMRRSASLVDNMQRDMKSLTQTNHAPAWQNAGMAVERPAKCGGEILDAGRYRLESAASNESAKKKPAVSCDTTGMKPKVFCFPP